MPDSPPPVLPPLGRAAGCTAPAASRAAAKSRTSRCRRISAAFRLRSSTSICARDVAGQVCECRACQCPSAAFRSRSSVTRGDRRHGKVRYEGPRNAWMSEVEVLLRRRLLRTERALKFRCRTCHCDRQNGELWGRKNLVQDVRAGDCGPPRTVPITLHDRCGVLCHRQPRLHLRYLRPPSAKHCGGGLARDVLTDTTRPDTDVGPPRRSRSDGLLGQVLLGRSGGVHQGTGTVVKECRRH